MTSVSSVKPKGRMTAYAFFVRHCREESKRKDPDGSMPLSEFSKKCSEQWKNTPEPTRNIFVRLAVRDKKRYDDEMKDYVPPPVEPKRRGKKRKDPNAPKSNISAFFWFCQLNRKNIKDANPTFGVTEMQKELGRMWKEASPETKQKCEILKNEDRARFDREMAVYLRGNATAAPAKRQC